MTYRAIQSKITGTAPSTASTAVVGSPIVGLDRWESMLVTASIAGNTGGTLNVYVQRYDVELAAWVDWIAFPQRASGAAVAVYVVSATVPVADIYTVGTGTSPALTADSYTGGYPGDQVRVIAVSGASTSAGGAITVTFAGHIN